MISWSKTLFNLIYYKWLINSAYIQEILSNPADGEIIDFNFEDFVNNPIHLRRFKAGLSEKGLAEKMETVTINNTPLSAFGGFSSQEENILLADL